MIENIHLWHADRGTYFDNNINIISWSDQYHIYVGKYCSIGKGCNFFLHANHRSDWITTSSQLWGSVTDEIAQMHMKMGHPSCKGDIHIGNDVWIGQKATIMSGIKIGDGAIISANAHVVKNVKPYSVVGGNPAEFLCFRFNERQIKSLLKIKWWDWPEDKIKSEAMTLWSNNIDEFIDKFL